MEFFPGPKEKSPLIASRLSRLLQGNSFQAAFLVILILIFFPWHGIPSMGGFTAARYFLTYADAFMPGAFVGTFADFLIRWTESTVFFSALYLLILAGYAAGIASWIDSFLRSRNREHLTLLFLLFLSLPSTWMPLRADFGRLDMAVYALTFLSCHWIVRKSPCRWAVPFLIVTVSLMMEEAVLMVIPVILAVAFRKREKAFSAAAAGAALLALVLCFCLWKTMPPAYLVESRVLARNVSSYPVYYVPAELRNTMTEHLARIGENLFMNGESSLGYLFSFLFYLAALILPVSLWIRIFRDTEKKGLFFLFLAAFLPLFLIFWNLDLNRYLTASLFAHFVLLSYVLTDPEISIVLPLPDNRTSLRTLLLTAFFLIQFGATGESFSTLSSWCAEQCRKGIESFRIARIPGEKEFLAGWELVKKKQMRQAMPFLRKSMEAGHPEGMAACGLGIYMGYDNVPNPEKAFPLFLKAAQQGSDLGRHMTANALIHGDGIKADPVRGVDFLRKAVRRQHLRESEFLLSRCLSEGIGTKKDLSQAFVYLWLSACGNPNAAYDLARHYLDGKLVPPNLKEAAFWANRSGADGHPGGQYLLASLLWEGAGISGDRPRAVRLLKASAAQGYLPASNMLKNLRIQ